MPIDGQSLLPATKSKLFYFRISELKGTGYLHCVYECRIFVYRIKVFFTSTFAAQFVENYYYKDEKSSNQ